MDKSMNGALVPPPPPPPPPHPDHVYSITHSIHTDYVLCLSLFCEVISPVFSEFMWYILQFTSGLLHWLWANELDLRWAIFLCSIIFPIFQHCQNTRWLKNITFIFDRFRRSWAAVTHVKYVRDSTNVTGNFAKSNISIMEKLTNRSLVNPTCKVLGSQSAITAISHDCHDVSNHQLPACLFNG